MTVIEVHPEELLDRELRGTLGERERALLEAHLQRCRACCMERQLRADFERELSAPAQGLDLQLFVSDAIGAIESSEASSQRDDRTATHGSRRGWSTMQRLAVIMVACTLASAAVGVAAAQLGLAERAWLLVRESVDATFRTTTPARPARKAKAVRERPPDLALETALPPQSQLPTQASEAARVPAAVTPPRRIAPAAASRRSEARGAAAGVSALQMQPARLVESPAALEPAPPPTRASEERAESSARPAAESAAALFENANIVRHRGHAIEASGLYRELQARYPQSAEARLSVAVVARMLLDRGENRAALAGFDAYLASSDAALREEATTGRVRALQRLGRLQEARDAARDLLDRYPVSAFAPAAQKLLESSAP